MSWSIYVKVEDGRAEVTKTYGDLEDGATYIISGHEHEGHDSLGVSRQREPREQAKAVH